MTPEILWKWQVCCSGYRFSFRSARVGVIVDSGSVGRDHGLSIQPMLDLLVGYCTVPGNGICSMSIPLVVLEMIGGVRELSPYHDRAESPIQGGGGLHEVASCS